MKPLPVSLVKTNPRKYGRSGEIATNRLDDQVWQARKFTDMVLIKTLFYTGVRVSELVNIRLQEVDLERCQIRIQQGKGGKDRMVPFPPSFRELLGLHIQQMQQKQACYLFESVRKHKYSDRGVRRMLERYAVAAGITRSLSPHKWRHFLFTWLKGLTML